MQITFSYRTLRIFRSSLFALFLASTGLFFSVVSCDTTKPSEKSTEETGTTEKTTETTSDASPQETSNNETTSPEEASQEDISDNNTQEVSKETAPEPQPEAAAETTPEPTPTETTSDVELTKGACQDMAPRCPPGYGCRDDVTPPTCHLSCDPETPNCPAGRLCLVQSTGAGICVEGTVAQKNETCDLQKICDKGLVCVLSSPPKGTCYQRCTLKNLQCSTGEVCFLAHSKNGACIAGAAGQKAAGEKCSNTLDCVPGAICFLPFQQTEKICATLCDTDHPCPSTQTCAPIDGAPKDSGACK